MSQGGFVKRFSLASLVAAAVLIAAPGSASAATSSSTVGQNFAPDLCGTSGSVTALQVTAVGNPYTVTAAGVITSWSFQTGSSILPNLKLKVAHLQSPPGTFQFVGEAAAGAQTPNAVNTYPANIPVQPGDVIGIHAVFDVSKPCVLFTADPNDSIYLFSGDPSPSTTATVMDGTSARLPVSATVTTTIASCKGTPATIVGTSGDDLLSGTRGPDVMVGLGGNDQLSGLASKDLICGGTGKDKLSGGEAKDTLLGQGGKDQLKGGKGRDLCKGGKGKDTASACEVEKSI